MLSRMFKKGPFNKVDTFAETRSEGWLRILDVCEKSSLDRGWSKDKGFWLALRLEESFSIWVHILKLPDAQVLDGHVGYYKKFDFYSEGHENPLEGFEMYGEIIYITFLNDHSGFIVEIKP